MPTRKTPFALSPEEARRVEQVDLLAAEGEQGLPRLLELLTDPSWKVRRSVIAALAALGSPAVEPLCELLREDRSDEARIAAAVDALVASVADVVGPVMRLSEHASPPVVADAAQVLGRRRPVAE